MCVLGGKTSVLVISHTIRDPTPIFVLLIRFSAHSPAPNPDLLVLYFSSP